MSWDFRSLSAGDCTFQDPFDDVVVSDAEGVVADQITHVVDTVQSDRNLDLRTVAKAGCYFVMWQISGIFYLQRKKHWTYSLSSSLCCLMTPGPCKNIWCHVWPYSFLCLQIIRSDIRPHAKWAVSLMIADDHLIFLRGFCVYVWVCMLYHLRG